jgi:hypothetical protein
MAPLLAAQPSWEDVTLQVVNMVQIVALAWIARGQIVMRQTQREILARGKRHRHGDGPRETPENDPSG